MRLNLQDRHEHGLVGEASRLFGLLFLLFLLLSMGGCATGPRSSHDTLTALHTGLNRAVLDAHQRDLISDDQLVEYHGQLKEAHGYLKATREGEIDLEGMSLEDATDKARTLLDTVRTGLENQDVDVDQYIPPDE